MPKMKAIGDKKVFATLNKGVSKLKSGFTPKLFHFRRTFLVDSGGIRRRNPRLEWRLNRVPYSEVMGTRNLKNWSGEAVRRGQKNSTFVNLCPNHSILCMLQGNHQENAFLEFGRNQTPRTKVMTSLRRQPPWVSSTFGPNSTSSDFAQNRIVWTSS